MPSVASSGDRRPLSFDIAKEPVDCSLPSHTHVYWGSLRLRSAAIKLIDYAVN